MPGRATGVQAGLRKPQNSESYLPIKGAGLLVDQPVDVVTSNGALHWTGSIFRATRSGQYAIAKIVQINPVAASDGSYDPDGDPAGDPSGSTITPDDVKVTVDNQTTPVTVPVDLYGD